MSSDGAWPVVLAAMTSPKLRRIGDLLAASAPSAEVGEAICDGETDRTLGEWWRFLTGERIDGAEARRRWTSGEARRRAG